MKGSLLIAGIVGLLLSAAIYWGGSIVARRIPILVTSPVGAGIVFALLLAVALAEMPIMIFGLRQMARSLNTPRPALNGTFVIYVTFAAVYAAAFVLVTGQFAWGLVLAALSLVRLASGIVIK